MTRLVKCCTIVCEMGEKEKNGLHKVFGAGIGWIVGGPVGAALGLLVGHTLQKNPGFLENGPLGKSLKPYYDVLQVPYAAGPEEIKVAYKSLVRKYHPDKFVDTEPVIQELAKEKMAEINVAYGRIMQRVEP